MFLLEHDAKTILAAHGVPVPTGVLVEATGSAPALGSGRWVVKAQVATGGRGKAGGVRVVESQGDAARTADEMLAMAIKGQPVRAVRIEAAVPAGAVEAYLSFLVDAAAGAVRVLLAEAGGVDIEARPDLVRSAVAAPEPAALVEAVRSLTATPALAAAAAVLASAFLDLEAMLLEINPLFLLPDGGWVAGDAKLVTDDNALPRQPALDALLTQRAEAYPDAHRKRAYGFDYVMVDPDGQIGLLTTGAGLSMKLIDELVARGLKPYNFLDIRTGELRGSPERLIHVLNWIADGPNVSVLLVNIFAGITHLGEFARLLVEALQAVPRLDVPVVARLVGNGMDEVRASLAALGSRVAIEPDLDRAVALAAAKAAS